MKQDALTFDELAHIPAGYSYLSQQDYRVNPEHPPLIKDLSAIPLLFLDLEFPINDSTWTQENDAPAWWVQFDLGTKFIYGSDNNPRDIIFWSRIPMILLLLFLGWFLFRWAREIGGNYLGLGVLTIFAFSPTLIAHGRLVTTDIGAAFGVVFSTYFWLKFLKHPTKVNIFLAGIAFGIAMIIKFSLILLVPFLGIVTIVYPLIYKEKEKFKNLIKYLLRAVVVGIIGLVFVILPIYQFHVLNYPTEHQIRDTAADLAPNKITIINDSLNWMADKPILKPIAQYLRGVTMATQRTSFGNTVYFLGEIAAGGWWYYFPTIYFLKVPLPFHLMTLISLIGLIFFIIKNKILTRKIFQNIISWIKENFTLFSFLVFLLIYWAVAMMGNLNIGVRHLLPTFPFIYILVIFGIIKTVSNINSSKLKRATKGLIGLLFACYIITSLVAFPHYLPYFNKVAGGTENGYKLAVDSNYDWGQDFYRLLEFVEKNNIDKINLDYFGGENPEYWLGDKYVKLEPKKIKEPPKGWVAVSLNQLQGGLAEPVPGFDQETGYYKWLSRANFIGKAGYSIFIYYVD